MMKNLKNKLDETKIEETLTVEEDLERETEVKIDTNTSHRKARLLHRTALPQPTSWTGLIVLKVHGLLWNQTPQSRNSGYSVITLFCTSILYLYKQKQTISPQPLVVR